MEATKRNPGYLLKAAISPERAAQAVSSFQGLTENSLITQGFGRSAAFALG